MEEEEGVVTTLLLPRAGWVWVDSVTDVTDVTVLGA